MYSTYRDSWGCYGQQMHPSRYYFDAAGGYGARPMMPWNEMCPPYDLAALAGVRRKNATRETTVPLKTWLNEHRRNPYPTKGEKMMLAFATKMSLTQVSTWFANARRRLKKENKMTWVPRNRSNSESREDASNSTGGSDALDENSNLVVSKNDDTSEQDNEVREGQFDSVQDTKLEPSPSEKPNTMQPSTSTEPSSVTKGKIWSLASVLSEEPSRSCSCSSHPKDVLKAEISSTTPGIFRPTGAVDHYSRRWPGAPEGFTPSPSIYYDHHMSGSRHCAYRCSSLAEHCSRDIAECDRRFELTADLKYRDEMKSRDFQISRDSKNRPSNSHREQIHAAVALTNLSVSSTSPIHGVSSPSDCYCTKTLQGRS